MIRPLSRWRKASRREQFGKRITAMRRLRRVNQTDLANVAEVSQSKISKIESGALLPTIEELPRILKHLNVSLERFMKGIYEL